MKSRKYIKMKIVDSYIDNTEIWKLYKILCYFNKRKVRWVMVYFELF